MALMKQQALTSKTLETPLTRGSSFSAILTGKMASGPDEREQSRQRPLVMKHHADQ
jgi:hypothetical protein